MSARRALITGISGQDGSYLAELLLERGYEVTGVVRGELDRPLPNIDHIRPRLELLQADLVAPASLVEALESAAPDEVYHLAAPSFVPDSWRDPSETLLAIGAATAALLQCAQRTNPDARIYVASSSEIFGSPDHSPQSERTALGATTPYGAAKVAAHLLVGVMRDRHGMHASSGITFNHESPRRPESFVTRKVTRAAAAISLGLESELRLGDLEARRDWCFAGDVARGAWLMLQQDQADDYVLASGVTHTVRELVDAAFAHVGLVAEQHVRTDPVLVRPHEEVLRVGDITHAGQRLGWSPEVSFERMIGEMVEHDLRRLRRTARP